MNFVDKIREKFAAREEEEEQLLLLELSEAELKMHIQQQGEVSLRTVQLQLNVNDDGFEAYFKELVRALRSELLWHVEEAAEVVFVLPEEWCYLDRLELPDVDKRELQRTLEWELEQYVPWPRNNYYYDTHCLGDAKNTYLIAATSQQIVAGLLQVGEELAVHIKEITTAVSVDEYLANRPHPNLLPPKYKRQIKYRKDARLAEIIFAAAVAASVCLAVGAWGWRYWHMENLQRTKEQLSALSLWEERMEWTEAAQRRLNNMQRIVGLLDKDKKPLLPQLELWGTTVGDSCWLERIEADQNSNGFVLRGRGMDADVVTAFLERLKGSGLYKSVELVEMHKDGAENYVGFVARLMVKEGKK